MAESLVDNVVSWKPEKTRELEIAVGKLPIYLFKKKDKYYYPPIIAERTDFGEVKIYPIKRQDLPDKITPPLGAIHTTWTKKSISFTYLGFNYEILTKRQERD